MSLEAKFIVNANHTNRQTTPLAERIYQALKGKGDIMPVIESKILAADETKSLFTVITHIRVTRAELTGIVRTACDGFEVKEYSDRDDVE